MWRPPVEKEAPRLRNVDVVVAQQFELIEHQQQACGIAAGVDAIELMHHTYIWRQRAPRGFSCRLPGRRAGRTRRLRLRLRFALPLPPSGLLLKAVQALLDRPP